MQLNFTEDLLLHYRELLANATNLEKELFSFVKKLTDSASHKLEKNTLCECQLMNVKLQMHYGLLCAMQESIRINLDKLNDDVKLEYNLQIVKGYCFYFYANNIFSYLLQKEVCPSNWRSINHHITRAYHVYKENLYKVPKEALYFCHTLISMINFTKLDENFHNNENDKLMLGSNLMMLDTVIETISYGPLKSHCCFYLFNLDKDYQIKPLLEKYADTSIQITYNFFQEIVSDVEHKKIIIDKNNLTENTLFYFFAQASLLFTNLAKLHFKIQHKKGKTNKIFRPSTNLPNTASSINLKNEEQILKFLKDSFCDSQIAAGVDTLGTYTKTNVNISINKIFQIDQLLVKVLSFFNKCLQTLDATISYLLTKNKYENLKKEGRFHLLKFREQILALLIKNDSILSLHAKQDANGTLLERLGQNNRELEVYEEQLNVSKKIYEELDNGLAQNKSQKKIAKKIQREKAIRNAYKQSKNLGDNATEREECSDPKLDKIYELFSQKLFPEALSCCQKASEQENNPNSLRLVNIMIAQGDIYQAMKQDSKGEQRDLYQKNSVSYYRQAQTIAQTSIEIVDDPDVKKKFMTVLDMAKSLADEIAEIESAPKKTSTTAKIEPQHILSEATEKLPVNVKPVILNKHLPLPRKFKTLHKILRNKDIEVFIVGGFIRDYFLNQKPYDVDVVIFPKTFDADQIPATSLLLIIKTEFPSAEIRSKKYPIIYIEEEDNIFEISIVKGYLSNPNSLPFSSDETMLPVLYKNAKERDTTENAIFYQVAKQRLIDFFGGINHIESHQLVCVKPPEISFEEDATRIFRILRSIIRRSSKNVFLNYNGNLIQAMKNFSAKLQQVNKDKCFTELKKILFRGYALPTWQFLTKHGLENYFFVLPSKSNTNKFRHSLMIGTMLANLDYRVANKTDFNSALVFAVFFWGVFQEKLAELNNRKNNSSFKILPDIIENIFHHPSLIFRLDEPLRKNVVLIWQIYLSTNHIIKIPNLDYGLRYFRLANRVFSQLISKSMSLSPTEKVNRLLSGNKSGLFKSQKIDYLAQEIIRENELILIEKDKIFSISSPTNRIISQHDKHMVLKNLKWNLKIILGEFGIDYDIKCNTIIIKTDSMLIFRLIKTRLDFLFAKNDTLSEQRSIKHT